MIIEKSKNENHVAYIDGKILVGEVSMCLSTWSYATKKTKTYKRGECYVGRIKYQKDGNWLGKSKEFKSFIEADEWVRKELGI